MRKKHIGQLCAITDTHIQSRFSHVELARLALQGGADIIQLRDKTLPTSELFCIAKEILTLCQALGGKLIINDRADIALAADADGVHLGQDDLPIAEARKLLGENKIIGATASTLALAKQAEFDGADYIGFGHIFPTSTKHKPEPPKGVLAISEIKKSLRIPVMAIGGIDYENIGEVMRAGADSAAVVSAICCAENPEAATQEIKKQIAEAIK
ncbi:thiamine-phosphate pyrophosphorylase [Chloroherpeton thalassium ATCC 35110]|uniref:Thiamine-phosphate synthase n=1 Tax=Chloroherpeton thalassium (strain ATCC 35110 / GB-78) TaxID=517418 RepID=B3QUZ3_CHLT3|nr:thiamine phosphate synthase [Chloroherpeton thalassium]ACF14494.1 thiamine-phosphate pyrophosphorylase [Chloroherpeton thalassium ATCC 35110]